MGHKTTRREFLKQMALTGAALTVLPNVVDAAVKGTGGKSRVVMATDRAVMPKEGEIAANVVNKMLGQSMAKLTDSKTGAEAWKKLFSPKDVVGIKVNCLFGKGVSTRPEMVDAVIAGLKMAGVDENNIIVWDRSSSDLIKCGFIPNKTGPGVKYFADDNHWGPEVTKGNFKGKITTVIDEKVTAIVNMPILKTHGMTGISCCLKNHYGSFDNPGNHHGDNCIAMADFNSLPKVVDKTRLVVVDAVRPQCNGGPGLQAQDLFNYYSLMVSKDPVAADYEGLQIIRSERSKRGYEDFPEKKVAWLKASQDLGCGTCDPGEIEFLKI